MPLRRHAWQAPPAASTLISSLAVPALAALMPPMPKPNPRQARAGIGQEMQAPSTLSCTVSKRAKLN